MTGRRNLFLCGLSLLVLLLGSSKGDEESDENNIFSPPKDCSDIFSNGKKSSGVYTISPNSNNISVYCDMDTDDGGWTVIQRRGNFTPLENFYRKWDDYKQGFGNIEKDFWLGKILPLSYPTGNDMMHVLSTRVPVEIRFDLADVRGERRFAKYKSFHIDDESKNYTLHISGYSGDAGDGMRYHDGQEFSTKDRGNNRAAVALKGAWWIFEWAHVHLNGFYDPGMDDFQAVHWYDWLENEGLAFAEMKIRQRSV